MARRRVDVESRRSVPTEEKRCEGLSSQSRRGETFDFVKHVPMTVVGQIVRGGKSGHRETVADVYRR